MIDKIKSLFREKMTPVPESQDTTPDGKTAPSLQVAACALLLEVAYADKNFSDSECRHLVDSLQRHFGLDDETTDELVEIADQERRRAADLYGFTSLIAQHYDMAQKMVLLEVMWGLVYADGEVSKYETSLMGKISNLLDVKPAFLSEARKKVFRGQGHID